MAEEEVSVVAVAALWAASVVDAVAVVLAAVVDPELVGVRRVNEEEADATELTNMVCPAF